MKILVTGASGAVGSYVEAVFAEAELMLTDIQGAATRLDICDPEAVADAVRGFAPDVVLHLAAATDVDRCEQEPDLAYRTNAVGTQNVALACRAAGAELVYISTAGVFSGDKPDPYTEFDSPGPANVYGHAKLAGERAVESLLDRFYIVRAGWMIGGAELDKKFVGKLTELIRGGATQLRAVEDKWGSPTYARDLLTGIRMRLGTGYHGLYHLVNDGGACSRYDIALELRAILGRPEVEIEAVSSAYFPLPAPRARSEAMRNYRLQLLGIDPMPHWRDALREYVENELIPVLTEAGARS